MDEISLAAGSFVLPEPTVPPPSGENPVLEDLTLTGAGAGATTLEGSLALGYCIPFLGCGGPDVRIRQLTIRGPSDGTGIASLGGLELDRVIVTGSRLGVVGGRLRIERSAIVGNDFGISAAGEPAPPPDRGCYPGLLDLVNGTVSGNHGIGLWCAQASLWNSTVASSQGLAIEVSGGHSGVSLRSSILTAELGPACFMEGAWMMISSGHNVASDASCGLDQPTDLPGFDPLLGPLQANGGPTPTHALLPGSPAINAIPPEDCTYDDDGDPGTPEVPLATDQRGVRRPQNGRCEIGAFERGCGLGAEVALLLPLLGVMRRCKT